MEGSVRQLDELLIRALEPLARTGAGDSFQAAQQSLSGLAQRLREHRFHLAVLGQFKRGKSTLLNALLGEPLLPTAVVPLTAIPTFLRAGKEMTVTVSFLDDRAPHERRLGSTEEAREILRKLVTEEANPQNRLGIASVEVRHPSPFLAQGVVLVDTPGIGSTLRHNTEATLRFLPQCDAALFVVSADPPLTDTEAEFLSEVERRIAQLFIVFNKKDYLDDEEELRAALAFLRGILARRGGLAKLAPVFATSAKLGVRARTENSPALWAESGLEAVEQHLLGFLVRHKDNALAQAVAAKAADILGEAILGVKLMRRSMELPLEDLEHRLRVFEAKVEEVSAERLRAIDLLEGDRRRTLEYLEEQAEALRHKTQGQLLALVERNLAANRSAPDAETLAEQDLAEAVPAMFERELGNMSEALRCRIETVMLPHQSKLDELLAAVRRAAADTFDLPHLPSPPSSRFEIGTEPYWVKHAWSASLGPVSAQIVEKLLPANARAARVRKRLGETVRILVVRNVENLRWSALQSLENSFRRFRRELGERLDLTAQGTREAIEQARARREAASTVVEQDISRLSEIEEAILESKRNLEGFRHEAPSPQ